MTELKLRLQEGDRETTVSVEQNVFTIGRLPECDLYLPFGGVSRNHARLVKQPNEVWMIEDLGSKNGTQVNQRLITSAQKLYHGDVVWLGNVSLVVVLSTPVPQMKVKPNAETAPQKTILHNVKQLQQQWIDADSEDSINNKKDKTIARLKDLVDIAKNLSAATSIEEIFVQVQEVVFRYLNSIDRLALLIDVEGSGTLELMNAAARNVSEQQSLVVDDHWISHSI
jgi:adenylate cyclase